MMDSSLHAGYNHGHCEHRPLHLAIKDIPFRNEKKRTEATVTRVKSKSPTGKGDSSGPG